ncbi:MAG: sulfotransferase [Actinobacteria bacterium]|nr:sulfotransferase [Actinomycetota bacterium]
MENERRQRWVPPPRPEWVARINAEGDGMDTKAIVPLDENSLLASARANTGLSDFGDEAWREPFRVLIESLDDEAELNLLGRIMTRADLLMFLEARLRIEDTYRRHPEIDDETISAPLVIVGQGRTGTSFLQGMLAADPASGTLTNWEVMFPCPPPEAATYTTDGRIARADHLITMWNRVAPEIEAMHEFAGDSPTENIHLHCLSFRSPAWFSLLGQIPTYSAYMMGQDPALPYLYEQRVLKLLQWRNPRRTWILKSPVALMQMPVIRGVYPDAGFIWTHRDPVKALASVVDLIGTLYWMRTDHPFLGDSLAQFTNAQLAGGMMALPTIWLDQGLLPAEALCNVQYHEFVADPLAVAAQIYARFDLELTADGRAAMERYVATHTRDARPVHRYDLGDQDLIDAERTEFKQYQDYFGVPSEV